MQKTYGIKRGGVASSELIEDAPKLFHDSAWHTEKAATAVHPKAIYEVSEHLSCDMLYEQIDHARLQKRRRVMAEQARASNLRPANRIPVHRKLNIFFPMISVTCSADKRRPLVE